VLRQGSFAADVELVRAAGIAAIGVDAGLVDAIGADEARRVLDGAGVAASSYMTLEDVLAPDGTASLDETRRRLDIAARLGAPCALIGTGPLDRRALPEAERLTRGWLSDAGPVALERGVRIMLEPMHPLMRRWSFLHTLRDALELVEGIDGVGVALDLGHVWWERGLPDLIRAHVELILSVQVTDIDTQALDDIRYERAPLGAGDVPIASLVEVLEAAGYRGWYENEVLARIPRERRLDMLLSSREWFAALGT
jgi:sugar phosphate isomerase/epimerase